MKSLHHLPQPFERVVPVSRDLLEIPAGAREPLRLELPQALATPALTAHEARVGQGLEVLRDCLPRDARPGGQTRDREAAAAGEPGDDMEARPVSERGEDR